MKKTVFSILLLLTFVVAKGQDIPQTKPVVKSVIYVPQALPPSSPTIGEKYLSTNGSYYRWDGSSWILDVVGGTNDASDLTTGVLNDGRVQQSNVTQHQSALVLTESQISDLSHTVDTKLTNSEVEAAYNAQVPVVTQGIAETGTSTLIYRWTPQMINYAIQANAPAQSLSSVLVEGADANDVTITNLGPPTSANDAARKADIDAISIDTDGINKTADFTLSDLDIIAQILNIQTNDSIVCTVPSGLTETGFVKMIIEGTGFVAVKQGTISTINGEYKSQSGEGETLSLRIKDPTEAVILNPSDLIAYAPVIDAYQDTSLEAKFSVDGLAQGDEVDVASFSDDTATYTFESISNSPNVNVRGDGKKELVFTASNSETMDLASDFAALDFDPDNDEYTIVIAFGNIIPGNSQALITKGQFGDYQFGIATNSTGSNISIEVGGAGFTVSGGRDNVADAVWIIRRDANGFDLLINDVEILSNQAPGSTMYAETWQLAGRANIENTLADVAFKTIAFYSSYLSDAKLTAIYNQEQ